MWSNVVFSHTHDIIYHVCVLGMESDSNGIHNSLRIQEFTGNSL